MLFILPLLIIPIGLAILARFVPLSSIIKGVKMADPYASTAGTASLSGLNSRVIFPVILIFILSLTVLLCETLVVLYISIFTNAVDNEIVIPGLAMDSTWKLRIISSTGDSLISAGCIGSMASILVWYAWRSSRKWFLDMKRGRTWSIVMLATSVLTLLITIPITIYVFVIEYKERALREEWVVKLFDGSGELMSTREFLVCKVFQVPREKYQWDRVACFLSQASRWLLIPVILLLITLVVLCSMQFRKMRQLRGGEKGIYGQVA